MSASASLAESVQTLRTGFGGMLLLPGDAGYDEARKVHNGLIDKRPALIARCHGAADVVDAVNLARTQGLTIAVRGGGHNVAGRSTVESGLMIDLSLMRAVQVDTAAHLARVQGGATWGDFNRETQLHGLACTGGVVSTTGVGGLTLGGGLGWLMGQHALALDNLVAVDLVLADGRAITASERAHADLFWALRGGGGNFGVATSFTFRLHKVGPTVTGGLIAWPFDTAWDMLRRYRDITADLPDEFSVFAGLVHAPDGSGTKLAAMVMCHAGEADAGAKAVAPIKAFGTPAVDAVGPMPYAALNGILDAAYPKGALNYWKSNFLTQLNDDAIRTMIDSFASCPTPMGQLLIEHFHGAVTRIAPTATAFPHRAPGYNFLVLSEWLDSTQNDACIGWARETYTAMAPYMGSGRYVNYVGDDEPADAVAASYGPNYQRLQQVKATYDPGNLFRMNQNIAPAA